MTNFGSKHINEEDSKKPKIVGLNQPSGLLRKSQKTHDSTKVSFGKTPENGLGVFARKDIKDGELIEVSPLIIVDSDAMQVNKLNDYIFTISKEEDVYAVALGYGSLYNHSEESNADWTIDVEKEQIRFIASEEIQAGQQITVSYGTAYWDSRNKEN